jgi:hypothetical protein
MSLFLLAIVGWRLTIREEGVNDGKAARWYLVYTLSFNVYIVNNLVSPRGKEKRFVLSPATPAMSHFSALLNCLTVGREC